MKRKVLTKPFKDDFKLKKRLWSLDSLENMSVLQGLKYAVQHLNTSWVLTTGLIICDLGRFEMNVLFVKDDNVFRQP